MRTTKSSLRVLILLYLENRNKLLTKRLQPDSKLTFSSFLPISRGIVGKQELDDHYDNNYETSVPNPLNPVGTSIFLAIPKPQSLINSTLLKNHNQISEI